MSYAILTVIVDGALDEEEQFTDEPTLNERVSEIRQEFEADGLDGSVDVRYHEHDPNTECECAQHEADHHPAFEFESGTVTGGRWA